MSKNTQKTSNPINLTYDAETEAQHATLATLSFVGALPPVLDNPQKCFTKNFFVAISYLLNVCAFTSI